MTRLDTLNLRAAEPQPGSRSGEHIRERGDVSAVDVEDYRIAQLFHEMRASLGDAMKAAQHVSRRHAVSISRVFVLAATLKQEPFWRL